MVDLLVGSIDTSTNWIGLSRPFPHHPLNYVQHANSLVPCSWHILQGGLDIWGVKECSFRRRRIRERIIIISTICSFSTRTVGPPTALGPPTTVSRVNWATINWMKWRKRSRLCNLALRKGRLAIGNGEGQENFPRERWYHVRPLILFHRQLHKLCSSSDYLSSLVETQSSSSSFSTPSSVTHNKIDHFGLNEIKKRLIEYLAAVCLKERNADKEAAATTVARRLVNKLKLIDGGKPTGSTSSDVPVPLMIPSLSAPLPRTKGCFCSPLKDPG